MAEVSPLMEAVKMSPKKSSTSSKEKRPKAKPTHPKTSEMVTAAISNLKERGGSSLFAIKKYIVGTYVVDVDRQAPFIKRYLKIAVEQGEIIQTKGRGATGSFKLAPKLMKSIQKKTPSESKKVAEKPVAKKPKTAKSDSTKIVDTKKTVDTKKIADTKKSAVTKKATIIKKSPVKKAGTLKVKIADPKKATKKAATKSPSKKTTKAPTAKPKAPKPKKIAAKKPVKTATK